MLRFSESLLKEPSFKFPLEYSNSVGVTNIIRMEFHKIYSGATQEKERAL